MSKNCYNSTVSVNRSPSTLLQRIDNMDIPNIAFLLDSAPRTWSSQEDRHLAICRALAARGSRAVLVFASELPAHIQQRFVDGGVSIETINYSKGPAHYYRELRRVIEKNSIECVHIIFFDYF